MYSAREYPYIFEVYCGKDDKRTNTTWSNVDNTMLEPIYHIESHVVSFNTFFTSLKVLSDVAENNIRACAGH